jgi:hypothetical protein
MAWEAIMMRYPEGIGPSELPDEWKRPSIGTAEQVKAAFEEAFPGQRHEIGMTSVDGDGFWIKFGYGCHIKDGKIAEVEKDDLVQAISIRSNAGPGAVAVLRLACENLGCRILDFQTGEFADFSEATESSMKKYTEWRDRMLRERPQADDD